MDADRKADDYVGRFRPDEKLTSESSGIRISLLRSAALGLTLRPRTLSPLKNN
jgi:hypothetical protein